MKKVLIPVSKVWDYATDHGKEIRRKPAIIATEENGIEVYIHSFTSGFGIGVKIRGRKRWNEVCWIYAKDRKECEDFLRRVYSDFSFDDTEVSA